MAQFQSAVSPTFSRLALDKFYLGLLEPCRLKVCGTAGWKACVTRTPPSFIRRAGLTSLALKSDPTVLLIDSEKASRRLLWTVLKAQGYRVLEAETGTAGIQRTVEHKPDLIILEIALAHEDGMSVLQNLREWNLAPVLVLSERADDQAKVAALDAGASDYLTKPFSTIELLARLRVLLRPLPNVPDGPFLVEGELVANLTTHQITIAGRNVRLTPKEEVLFCVLARYAGRVVTCAHLMRSVWGLSCKDKTHDLQVLVWQLRKKLGVYGAEVLVQTEGSTGYRLSVSASADLATHSAKS